MINHRGPEFAAMLDRILDGMKPYFGTTNDVAMLSSRRLRRARGRRRQHAVARRPRPRRVDRLVRRPVRQDRQDLRRGRDQARGRVGLRRGEPTRSASALRRDPRRKAVLLTHNETSTGVMNPIRDLAAAVREEAPDALILVDSVSGLGAVPFEMDAWGVDVVVTGSQKAWMSAPGLAMIAASPRALGGDGDGDDAALLPRPAGASRRHANGQTPWTPAIAVVYQVDEGLRLMAAEGKAHVFARHEACAAAARAGLDALGFELFADPPLASKTVTAAHVPDDLDWKAFNSEVKRRGVVLAGGQGKLTGKIFRLGHLGSVTLEEILGRDEHASSSPRIAAGRPVVPGSGGRGSAGRGTRVTGSRGLTARVTRVRILVAEPVAQEGVELLRAHHDVDERHGLSATNWPRSCRDYDALVVRSQVQADAALIAAGTRLVVIGRAGVGVDNVDLEAATRAGITVVNAPTGQHDRGRRTHAGPALRRRPADRARPTRRCGGASGSGPSSPASSCAAGRSASSGSARSAWRSRCVPGRWR